jgi:hypothetical protein
MAPVDYPDGIAMSSGVNRASPRMISNVVNAQSDVKDGKNPQGATDMLWLWGQFLDHDITLTAGSSSAEHSDISVPAGDEYYDPEGTGTASLDFTRSAYDEASGASTERPREQINATTGWIDASQVYGPNDARAAALRTNDGSGRLKTSRGDLLPFNTEGLDNAGGPSPTFFVAGDIRANEHVGLTALHTLFVREHNRLADEIRDGNVNLSGDEVYQRARRWVGAEIQSITYNEFLPLLLGERAIPPYRGYDPEVDATIMNEFATAAFRLGHSMLSPTILRMSRNGELLDDGGLPLRDAFFAPQLIVDDGIEPLLRGFAAQVCQTIDPYIAEDVRSFLFGDPGAGGNDLASLNIQRGRDHGVPTYNEVRQSLGMRRAETFGDITSDPELIDRLARVYATPDDVDLWVGGLAEDHVRGAMVGPLFRAILISQFRALRDGDRFWYEKELTPAERLQMESTTLTDIIRRNTRIGRELPDDAFRMEPSSLQTSLSSSVSSRHQHRTEDGPF